jgi:hypothetical protein
MVWDGFDNYVLLFGGCLSSGCTVAPAGDTWIFQHGQWRQPNLVGNQPPAREIAGMAYDAFDQEVVMFGGLTGTTQKILNDTWVYANGTWTNLTLNLSKAPGPRYRASMEYDAADGYVVLFGGTSVVTPPTILNQTWIFSNQSWTDITNNATGHPAPRYRADMAYDAADKEIVLFGGCTTATRCGTSDTWTYSNYSWVNRTGSIVGPPSKRVYSGLTWDARDGYVLLYGGGTVSTGPALGSTWEFLNNSWSNLSSGLTVYPSARAEPSMAFDVADNLTLLFGGDNNPIGTGTAASLLSESWSFGPGVIVEASASPALFDQGQATTIRVNAVSSNPPLSYWYPSLPAGCSSQDTASLSCTPSAVGNYTVTVQVNDSTGSSANYSVNISTHADPSILSWGVSPTEVTVGSPVNFTVAASGGLPPYRYAYHSLPLGCAGGGQPFLNCSPTGSGNYTVEVQVTDAPGFSIYANTTLIVNARPGVASFTAAPAVLDRGQSTTFRATTTGGTAPLSYVYTGLPSGCVPANTASLTCTPDKAASSTVQVVVTDAFGWSANATVGVRVNPALIVYSAGISSNAIDVGRSVTLWLNVTGGTSPYVYSYQLPTGCFTANSSTVVCKPSLTGSFVLVSSATDQVGVTVNASLNLTVVPVVVVSGLSASPSVVDVGVPTTLAARYSNGTAPISFSYLGLPGGCVSANLPTISCTPAQAGPFTIEVTATDAWGFKSTFSTPLQVNKVPTISAFTASPSTVVAGSETTFQVNASGGTGGYVYSYGDLPTGCTSSNTSQLTCAPTQVGSFTVNVTIIDALGVTYTAQTALTVLPVPQSSGSPLGSGLGGGSLLWIALVVIVAAAALLALLWMRRRGSRPVAERAPPEEGEIVPAPWEEPPP